MSSPPTRAEPARHAALVARDGLGQREPRPGLPLPPPAAHPRPHVRRVPRPAPPEAFYPGERARHLRGQCGCQQTAAR